MVKIVRYRAPSRPQQPLSGGAVFFDKSHHHPASHCLSEIFFEDLLTNPDRFVLPDVLPCVLPDTNQRMNAYLKEIGDLAGVDKKLTTHVARHTFATTIALNNGIPLEVLQKMLGHAKISTTQIYAKIMDSRIADEPD